MIGFWHQTHSKILANTDPWASIERHKLPRFRRPMIPPLRAEDGRILKLLAHRRVQLLAALHGKRAVHHNIVLENTNVRLARRAGKGAVLEAGAQIIRHRGVQAQRLVNCVCEIGHVLQVRVGGCARLANDREDLVAQLGVDGGVVRELVDAPRQRGGGGVAAREEDPTRFRWRSATDW